MGKSIYRFMSFESFVDLVLREKISLVHPTLWDDPMELSIYQRACGQDDVVEDAIKLLQYKTFAQSWTELCESDAMWRIYSHNNMSIRICSSIEYFSSIKNLDIRRVIYTDDIDEAIYKYKQEKDYLQLLAIKRKVFEHEHEVRVISRYKYKDKEDIKRHLEAFWLLNNKNFKTLDNRSCDLLQECNQLVNFDLRKKTHEIPIDISQMISSVMLNPFAPKWFEKTVAIFCKQKNISFVGKSLMYDNKI